MALRLSLSQILSASVATWAELSWDQPSFDSPGQSGEKAPVPSFGRLPGRGGTLGPAHVLATPPSAACSACSPRLRTTTPKRTCGIRNLPADYIFQKASCCMPYVGVQSAARIQYPVNPVGSFSRCFIEIRPKCTFYLKRQNTEIRSG